MGALNAGITFPNRGDASVWRTVSVQGTPATPLAAAANGAHVVKKTVWTMGGAPADLANLHQNDRVIIVLSGQMDEQSLSPDGRRSICCRRGWRSSSRSRGDDGKAYPCLGTLTDPPSPTRATTALSRPSPSARNITADQIRRRPEPQPDFHLAYIARAVTAGNFVMPAGVVEDMYAPACAARTDMGRVTYRPEAIGMNAAAQKLTASRWSRRWRYSVRPCCDGAIVCFRPT